MVEREEGGGDRRQDVPDLYVIPEGTGRISERAGFPECSDQILAQGAWTFKSCPRCGVAGQAIPKTELYDAIRGGRFPKGCPQDAAPCPILFNWLVHRIEA